MFQISCKPALDILAGLPIICFKDRHRLTNINHKAKMSIDGMDCHIAEQVSFDGMWYSHTFKGPGLRYEEEICILTGYIVWIIGGYPCGTYPDLQIFREGLSKILEVGKNIGETSFVVVSCYFI